MNKKTAIVTGGSSGIGHAISQQLLARGMVVHSISRNPKGSSNDLLTESRLDLSDLAAVSVFAQSYIKENGAPDLLINNAGYGAFYEWEQFPENEILGQNTVLFSAPVLLCRAFAPEMAKAGRGSIVNVTSLAVLYPLPYMPMYNAAKSALSSFTQSLMLEYPSFPRLMDFRLGDVRTSFNQSAPKQAESNQSQSMRKAWAKIESQLQESVDAEVVARRLLTLLGKNRHGVSYSGTFFQSRIAPFLHRAIPSRMLRFILKLRYGL